MLKENSINHYEYIDALRGWAILSVIATHAGQMIKNPPDWLLFLTSKGLYGVQLFFIISSLTLFLSYEQRRAVDGKNTDKFFYLRRYFRIAPAFYVAIVAYTIVLLAQGYLLQGTLPEIVWSKILVFSLFLSVFYPASMFYLPFGGWTVEVEMLYYVFIPFLFRKIKSLKMAVISFFSSMVIFQSMQWIFRSFDRSEQAIYNITIFPGQLTVFLLGIVSYHLIKENRLRRVKPLQLLFFSFLFLAVSLVFCRKFNILPEFLFVAIALFGIVLAMSMKRFSLLQNKFTEYIGKISYSLYLWHFAVTYAIWYLYKNTPQLNQSNPVIAFVLVFISILSIGSLISALSYRLIESRGMKLGKKIINNIK